MNKTLFVALFVLAFVSVQCAEVTEDEHVIVLTQDNFDQVISQYENVLVKFYAPWCGHCKNMIPAYSKAAEHFKATTNTRIAKVDATIHKDLGSKFGVKGFPTIKFFQNGKDVEYQGGRDADAIIGWVNKKTLPPTSEVTTVEQITKLQESAKVVVVLFGEQESQKQFENVARGIDGVEFVTCNDESVKSHFQVTGPVVLFKQFDDKRADFTGSFEENAVRDFVLANKQPLVTEFDQEIAQEVFANNRPALFFFKGDDEKSKTAMAAVEAVAKEMKGKVLFSYAQVQDGFGKRLGDYIGVTTDNVPTVRIVQNTEDAPQKYALEGEITTESLTQLINDFKDGKLTPSLKSEEIPASQDGPVTVVVGKNFNQVVMDTTKDVLIEFYAPWCGHCKTLEPIFNQLGEKMKAHSSVVVAKMDATANEVQGLGVKGFPTIRYFPANNKAMPGVEYSGGRTLEDFVKYLEENKTVQWEAEAKKDDL